MGGDIKVKIPLRHLLDKIVLTRKIEEAQRKNETLPNCECNFCGLGNALEVVWNTSLPSPKWHVYDKWPWSQRFTIQLLERY